MKPAAPVTKTRMEGNIADPSRLSQEVGRIRKWSGVEDLDAARRGEAKERVVQADVPLERREGVGRHHAVFGARPNAPQEPGVTIDPGFDPGERRTLSAR